MPVLVVPPTINKFYAIDLAPERSLVEFSVRQGRQMFVMSWRNPDGRHAAWDLDTYATAILEALDGVERITGSEQTVLGGICSGGILASITAAYLATTGRLDRLAAICLAVTVLDQDRAGMAGALASPKVAAAAKAMSRRKGYLDGRALAEVFAWLRPGDLVWNYWVNNYLLGKPPPAFDILFWNSDTTRMTAGLHAGFVDMAMANQLADPGSLSVLGEPIDLSQIDVRTPTWPPGSATTSRPGRGATAPPRLFGGDSRFVLSTSGNHITALVNPQRQSGRRRRTTLNKDDGTLTEADEWLPGCRDEPRHLDGPRRRCPG